MRLSAFDRVQVKFLLGQSFVPLPASSWRQKVASADAALVEDKRPGRPLAREQLRIWTASRST